MDKPETSSEPNIGLSTSCGSLVVLGLGANLGDPARTLVRACDRLANESDIEVIARASLYQSAPVDAPGPHYTNTALLIRTSLSPLALLARTQAVENEFGRVRSVRNAPRTLDIDLVWHEHANLDDPRVTLPHPRMHERAFVLKPLAELLGEDFVMQGREIRDWLRDCAHQLCERVPGSR